MSENIFYVYEHWRPDKNVCFYVGKGKGKRAWDLKNMRNRYHKAVTSKLISIGFSVDIRIVIRDLSADAALSVEIDRIAMYGVENLTNMTLGGDGMKNPTPETRRRISEGLKASNSRLSQEERDLKFGHNKGRKASAETLVKLSIASTGRKHTPEVCARISAARKAAGIPRHVRLAQIAAATGKKRAPFKESTIIKMRAAAKIREDIKRQKKAVA